MKATPITHTSHVRHASNIPIALEVAKRSGVNVTVMHNGKRVATFANIVRLTPDQEQRIIERETM